MTDPQAIDPEENPVGSIGGLSDELSDLGKNLVGILRAAWERPERQKLQQEIEGGLSDLGSTLRKEARTVAENPVSQRIKTEVGDLGSRVRSGEMEGKVREEVVSALHIVNVELIKIANLLTGSDAETIEEADSAETVEAAAPAATPPVTPTETPGASPFADQQPVEVTPEASFINSADQQAGEERPETKPPADNLTEA